MHILVDAQENNHYPDHQESGFYLYSTNITNSIKILLYIKLSSKYLQKY